MKTSTDPTNTYHFSYARNAKAIFFIALVGFLILPIFARSILVHPPEYDELLHIMSARGILDSGAPVIADGVYARAELYTRIVAWFTQLPIGELVAGRLPALISAMLLLALIGGWVTRKAGWLAGLAAVGFLATSPLTLHVSVLVRFYTAHALLVTLTLILWFELFKARPRAMHVVCTACATAVLIPLANHLHKLTLIAGLAGLAAIIMLMLYHARKPLARTFWRAPWSISGLLLITTICALLAVNHLGVIEELQRQMPLWSANKAGNYAYYLSALTAHHPLFWPLFPVLIITAYLRSRRVTVFALSFLVTALVANSLASQKATRYFYYAYPMIAAIWGIGFQQLFSIAVDTVRSRLRVNWFFAFAISFLVLSMCLLNAQEVKRVLKLSLNRGALDIVVPVREEPNWALSKPILDKLIAEADTVVVTSGIKSLFIFGRYDYELSATVVEETDSREEFGTDPRTGRTVISQPESVRRVLNLPGKSVFVLENRMLNKVYSAPEASVDLLESQCERIILPSESKLSAWQCSTL